jgi:hypothetical protein
MLPDADCTTLLPRRRRVIAGGIADMVFIPWREEGLLSDDCALTAQRE